MNQVNNIPEMCVLFFLFITGYKIIIVVDLLINYLS